MAEDRPPTVETLVSKLSMKEETGLDVISDVVEELVNMSNDVCVSSAV